MRRYSLLAFIIGALTACVVYLLYDFGVIGPAASKLAVFLGNAGLLEGYEQPDKLIHIIVFTLVAIAVAWAVIDIPRPMEKTIVVITFAALALAMSPILALFGVFYEPFSTLVAIGLAALLAGTYSQSEPGRRKGVIEQVVGGRASILAKSGLLDGAPPEILGGTHREVTVLTIRAFNHNQLGQSVSPAEQVEMINLFLKNIGDFLTSRGAYIDESSPECVRAFFGAFQPDREAVFTACEAALKLRQRMSNLNSELERRFFNRLEYGIAISGGPVTLGVYNSDRTARLSAVGEVIEKVRVLCAANHVYGSQLLVGSDIYGMIRDHYAVRPMEMIVDPKVQVMTEVYELMEAKNRLSPEDEEARKAFWQGVILYREGKGEEALRIFSQLKNRYPHDRPLQYFIDRSQMTLFQEDPAARNPPEQSMKGHARVMPTI